MSLSWTPVPRGTPFKEFCKGIEYQPAAGTSLPVGILVRTRQKNGGVFETLIGDCTETIDTQGCGCCAWDYIDPDDEVLAYADLRPMLEALIRERT